MTTTSTNIPRWTYACAIACALFGFISIIYRYRTEGSNKAIALAVDADIVDSLGVSEGYSLQKSLIKLKDSDVNAVVLTEETVGDLISSGQIQLQLAPDRIKIFGDKYSLHRVLKGLSLRVPSQQLQTSLVGPLRMLEIKGQSPSFLRTLPIGLNPQQAKAVRQAGLIIIARCQNPTGATSATVDGTIKWARELGARIYVPVGEQVLGRRDLKKELSDSLKQNQMFYASPEFAKIGGDLEMLQLAPENSMRLHSAQAIEIDKMTEKELIERYAKAGAERDVRILLLRPFTTSTEKPLTTFGEQAKTVVEQLKKEGLSIGSPHPYTDPGVWKPIFVLLGLSIGGVVLGLLYPLLKMDQYRYVVGGVLFLLALGCWSASLRPYMALLGAIALPVLGFILLDERNGTSIIKEYAIVSLISLVGGLCVAGLLNMAPYFIRAQQFSGVKVAQFFPLLVIGMFFLFKYGQTKGLSKAQVLWGQIILGLVAITALGFMMMRSGNDNPAGVSGLELQLRSLLSKILTIRPRTKELFIGHPLMIIAIGMLIRFKQTDRSNKSMGSWVALALVGGAIGQTSIVNTLCHLHTPLFTSFVRILFGWVIGGVIGYIVWWWYSTYTMPRQTADPIVEGEE